MKNVYTVAATLVAIMRAAIGYAFMMPIVAICAFMDRLSAMLLIKGGYDYELVESVRERCSFGLTAHYDHLSRFE